MLGTENVVVSRLLLHWEYITTENEMRWYMRTLCNVFYGTELNFNSYITIHYAWHAEEHVLCNYNFQLPKMVLSYVHFLIFKTEIVLTDWGESSASGFSSSMLWSTARRAQSDWGVAVTFRLVSEAGRLLAGEKLKFTCQGNMIIAVNLLLQSQKWLPPQARPSSFYTSFLFIYFRAVFRGEST